MERETGMTGVTAADQLQRSFPREGIQPLPQGSPARIHAKDVGIKDPGDSISFFVIGDHGGVKAPGPQNAVSYAMQLAEGPKPAFVYSVGDIVYFNGDESEYQPQFYEAYGHLAVPIVGIPGNHDGDTSDDPSREPLDTFMTNFCDEKPSIPAADPHFEFGRHTQTQPYCDWTLELDALTITGIYSNVPSGGHLEKSQLEWLTGELADASQEKPLILCLHHPPFSIDAHHGGSKHMREALDKVFEAADRAPNLVLSGHVHDYQRFTRSFKDWRIPYVVIGNSGYHNLHVLAKGAEPGDQLDFGATFEYGDAHNYGFLRLTVSKGEIAGEYTGVRPGTMPDGSDASVEPGLDAF